MVFEKLWVQSQRQDYGIKTTEAPHYRRFVLQRGGDPLASSQQRSTTTAPLGVGDGKGVMFVSHTGEIYPAGFLPLKCGRFPDDSVVETYQNHSTFVPARSTAIDWQMWRLRVREVCGGSRSRAYAVFGDPMASEPDCNYSPVETDVVS